MRRAGSASPTLAVPGIGVVTVNGTHGVVPAGSVASPRSGRVHTGGAARRVAGRRPLEPRRRGDRSSVRQLRSGTHEEVDRYDWAGGGLSYNSRGGSHRPHTCDPPSAGLPVNDRPSRTVSSPNERENPD